MFNVRLAETSCMGNGFHLAVADDVFGRVLFCVVRFHTSCLGCGLGLNWASS